MEWSVITSNMPFLMGGLLLTLQLAAISLVGDFLLGVLIGLGRLSSKKYIYYPCSLYINFFRSQPLILIIFWFYFLVPFIIGRPLGDFFSACIAFVIFESAYFAEIIRGGIQSVPHGQVMAGYSTGLNYYKTMRYIILPQALRNMIPMIVTQSVIIFQDTSLAYVIGLKEFLRCTSLVDAREMRSLELYLFAGLVYLVCCSIGSFASRRLEQKKARS